MKDKHWLIRQILDKIGFFMIGVLFYHWWGFWAVWMLAIFLVFLTWYGYYNQDKKIEDGDA